MKRPVVGIIGNMNLLNESYPVHAGGTMNSQAVAEVANCDSQSIATALTESGARWLDGTSTAKDMFLNFVIDDNAAHGAGTATFTGTISFLWSVLGDN